MPRQSPSGPEIPSCTAAFSALQIMDTYDYQIVAPWSNVRSTPIDLPGTPPEELALLPGWLCPRACRVQGGIMGCIRAAAYEQLFTFYRDGVEVWSFKAAAKERFADLLSMPEISLAAGQTLALVIAGMYTSGGPGDRPAGVNTTLNVYFD